MMIPPWAVVAAFASSEEARHTASARSARTAARRACPVAGTAAGARPVELPVGDTGRRARRTPTAARLAGVAGSLGPGSRRRRPMEASRSWPAAPGLRCCRSLRLIAVSSEDPRAELPSVPGRPLHYRCVAGRQWSSPSPPAALAKRCAGAIAIHSEQQAFMGRGTRVRRGETGGPRKDA